MPNPGIDKGRITPEFMNALAEPLEAVFEMIKHDICVKLAEAFNIGRINTESNAWRSYKLAQMGEFRRSTVALIASYAQDIHKSVKDAIEAAVRAGIDACEPELLKGSQRAYVTSKDVTTRRVSEMYEAQALDSCNMVNTVMLNSTLENYRKITDELDSVMRGLAYDQQELNAQTGAVVIGAKTLQEAVKDAVTNMTDHGITGFVDKAGRQWSPEAYVHMDIRTTTCNAAREASFERNNDYGNNLISVTSHAGARPLCYPYQGKVYSTDGTSGTTTDLSGAKISYTPLSLTSYGQPAGLFGINCGHFNYPFVPGYSVVRGTPEPKALNDARYAKNQQQRAYERQIRGYKTRADALAAAGLTDEAKEMRSKARNATSNLKQWCEDNEQDYYADRVRVTKR